NCIMPVPFDAELHTKTGNDPMEGFFMARLRTYLTPCLLLGSILLCLLAGQPVGAPSSAHSGASLDQTSNERPLTPAGSLVMDTTTGQPAVAALPVAFFRSPDKTGPDGRGRYLVSVNSGFGIQFNGASNAGEQSLSIIDLNARPAPSVVQNVYFPSPQSVSVGAAFASRPESDGSYRLYVSAAFENKI